MNKQVVIYPGFFDPFTLGHKNIVERALRVFGEITVAVAGESPKTSLFTASDRLEIAQQVFEKNPKVTVEKFDGLLVDYVKKKKANILLRGIRTVSDFEYEYQMALANRTLSPDVETCFMMTEGSYSYLSSTLIKEIARLGGDVSKMVPPPVLQRIEKIRSRK